MQLYYICDTFNGHLISNRICNVGNGWVQDADANTNV